MNAKKQRRWPRILQGVFGYILTLTLTVSLTAACLLTLVSRLLTDQALHESIALNPQVIDAQYAHLEETVNGLAETYHFAPETVMDLIPRDTFEAYGREMTAWWMGLLGSDPEPNAPFPDTSAIEAAVRADELFRENTEERLRRTTARDHIAYRIGETIQRSVMPIRQSLISLAVPRLETRDLPGKLQLLATLRTSLFAASAVLFALLMLTQGKNRWLFGSVGLMAAFALLAAITALTAAANLPEMLAEFSPLLSLQLGMLQSALLPGILLVEGALFVLGLAMLMLCVKSASSKRSLA